MTECLIDTFQYSRLVGAEQSVDRLSVISKALVTLFLISRSKCLSDVVRYFLGRITNPLIPGFPAVFLKLAMNTSWARFIYFK